MATKTLYRVLNVDTGKIELYEHKFYSNIIVLEEIEVPYDDVLKEEHREQLIKAIESNIEEKTAAHNAEMFKLKQIKDQLLQLGHTPMEGELIPAEAKPSKFQFDEDEPF